MSLKDINLTVAVRVQPKARIAAVIITLLDRHIDSYDVVTVLRTAAAYFGYIVIKRPE